jgi:4'-phosphopantetheinyl transferase
VIAAPQAYELHVWTVCLDRGSKDVQRLHGLLSAAERSRAGGFPASLPKRRYLVRQGSVREILASYAGEAPERLRIVRGPGGKPALADGSLQFSVSDSGALALVAVGEARVGVDVERVRHRPALGRIAERVLGGEEAQAIARLEGHERLEAFYRAWTAHEAAAKVAGGGVFRAAGRRHGRRIWPLDAGEGLAASIAAESFVRTIHLADWPG